ncbi:unnamed protein product [marine sediment metagenome]|uniref:Uncharacterized protein n=1 Tax=marine sediment metagenome TaxID=412755 RepID=X1CW14_9ZZZZ
MAILGTTCLANCARNVVGLPLDSTLWNLETSLADHFRKTVSDFMSANVAILNGLPEVAQNVYLEGRDGEYDVSFEARITKNYDASTFAGALEISVAAFMLKTQIQVYQSSNCNVFKQIAVYPDNLYNCASPLKLLYSHDTEGVPGHFDVLLSNEETHEFDLLEVGGDYHTTLDKWAAINLAQDPNPASITLSDALCGDALRNSSQDDSELTGIESQDSAVINVNLPISQLQN